MKTEKRTLLTSRRRISVPLDRLRSIFSVSALWVRGLFPRHGRQSDASDGAGTGCDGRSGESSFCQTQGKLRSDPTGLFVLPAVFSCREIGISGREMAVCRPESTHRTGQQSTAQYSRVQHSRVQHSTAGQKKSAIPRREQRTWFLVCGCCGQIELMSIISQFSILMSPSRQRSSAETVSIEVRHGIARSTAVRRICTEPSSG